MKLYSSLATPARAPLGQVERGYSFARPKRSGTDTCGCGRVISANKTLCKACLDGVIGELNRQIREKLCAAPQS